MSGIPRQRTKANLKNSMDLLTIILKTKESYTYYGYNIASYLEEKEKLNISYTQEETNQRVVSQGCLALIVAECQLKQAMGFFGR
ncbi:hypothetical protein NPIL_586191 [Nephila pilipes]|uniref:Uncharacterized protein n=1 Tax=Nephila pilipes TaxID=299642 RepID=A0A8X6I3J0_NEPPI|nr:hypothetical protein NPIL_586191 [Nephila pilipes]